jgi:hypothetical protein
MSRSIRMLAVAALPFALAACGTLDRVAPGRPADAAKPDVPASIAVPSGNHLAFALKGTGLQTYECRAKPTGHDWMLIAPEAALHDQSDALVGRHFGGPTWEHADGSKVTGHVVAEAAAPTPGNLPWLLLKGTPSGAGAFAGTTYVQRIDTDGGTAPPDPCNASLVGTKKATRYSAVYRFFKG